MQFFLFIDLIVRVIITLTNSSALSHPFDSTVYFQTHVGASSNNKLLIYEKPFSFIGGIHE